MAQQWVAKWTGKFPNKCNGLWYLYMNGVDVSGFIPSRTSSASTLGKYSRWTFVGNVDSCSWYKDGLSKDDWIDLNKDWIDDIGNTYHLKLDDSDYEAVFATFNKSDWRVNSCGGCM